MNLSQLPIQKFFDSAGRPLNGGQLFTYVAGTSTKLATYTDSTGSTPNANPVPLNYRGEANVWLDPTLTYKFVLAPVTDTDPPTNPIWSVDNIVAGITLASLTQQILGQIIWPRTTLEIAAGVTPVNYGYLPGHLYRYGLNAIPGVTDMTAAAQNWAKVGGNIFMPLPEIVLVTGTLTLSSNTTVTIVNGAIFKNTTANISVFAATGQSNITITGGSIQQTVNGSTVRIGLISFTTCTNCLVDAVELIGAQWSAILLNGSSNNIVRGNYIHDSFGQTVADEDSHDIACYGASSFNIIDGNICYGGTAVEHGIMIQDPGSSLIPLKNIVTNNRIGPHKSYGILNYLIDHANTWCQIIGNEVEGITGTAQGGGSGMGIYNQGAGGTVIANNIVRNCCINTSAFSLVPAGITLNLDSAFMAVEVIGNHVSDIVNGSAGIAVNAGPAVIEGNVVIQSAGVTTNIGILVNTASNVRVGNNQISIDTSITTGIGIQSLVGANITNIQVVGNQILGCSARHIRLITSAAFLTNGITVTGNITTSASSNCIPLEMDHVSNGAVNGNSFGTAGNLIISASTCVQITYAGNILVGGTAAPQTVFSGVSNGSYFDKSNVLGTFVDNQSTGLTTELLRSATPGAGNRSAVGDRIEQQVPIVGNPKGWRCTVAGNPGTWISEGNL